MRQHEPLTERLKALCIQELPHGGFVVTEFPCGRYETRLLAAFTRLSDAAGWIEEAMRSPTINDAPTQAQAAGNRALG